MYKPKYKTASGQPVYSQPRWWQRIFGYQPHYLQPLPAIGDVESDSSTDDADDTPAAASTR